MGNCCGKPEDPEKEQQANKYKNNNNNPSNTGQESKGGVGDSSKGKSPGPSAQGTQARGTVMAGSSGPPKLEMAVEVDDVEDEEVADIVDIEVAYAAENGTIVDPNGQTRATQRMDGVLYFFDDDSQEWLIVPDTWSAKNSARGTPGRAKGKEPAHQQQAEPDEAIEFATFTFYDTGKELTTISRGGARLYCDFEANTWVEFPKEWMQKGEFSESPYTRDDLQMLDEDEVENEQTVQLRNQIKHFEKRVKEYAARQKEREKQISKQMETWKHKVHELETQNKELTAQNMKNAKRLEQALASPAQGRGSVVDSEEVERLRQQLEQAKRERDSAVTAAEERAEAAEARSARLASEKTDLANNFEEKLRAAISDGEAAGGQTEELRLKVMSLERELKEAHETESELRATLDRQQKEIERVTSEKQEREEAAFKLQDELIAAKQATNSAKAAGDRREIVISNLQTALRTALRQISNLRPYLQELRDEVHSQHANLNPLMESWTSDILKQIKRELAGVTVYKEKWRKEMMERKKIFNQLQELRGNIRVFCRVRGLTPSERTNPNIKIATQFPDEGEIAVISKGMERTFDFDQVFDMKADQARVFEEVKPLITSCVDGFHVCIFAYGQTGAGKTYTMMGSSDNRGVNYRSLEELFSLTKERSADFTFTIECSFLEIYNEQIRDLLSDTPVDQQRLDIRTSKQEGVHVPGLVKRPVSAIVDVMNVINEGESKRTTKATSMNEHSSRSHSLLIVEVTGINEGLRFKRSGKLTLVDLAGSERVSKSEASGQRLVEAQNINKSLSALGNVLCSLQTEKSHVPFRDSKITHLLSDSLRGDSKVLMFVNASPKASDADESLCTFKFGERARKVVVGQAKAQTGSMTPSRTPGKRGGSNLPKLG